MLSLNKELRQMIYEYMDHDDIIKLRGVSLDYDREVYSYLITGNLHRVYQFCRLMHNTYGTGMVSRVIINYDKHQGECSMCGCSYGMTPFVVHTVVQDSGFWKRVVEMLSFDSSFTDPGLLDIANRLVHADGLLRTAICSKCIPTFDFGRVLTIVKDMHSRFDPYKPKYPLLNDLHFELIINP